MNFVTKLFLACCLMSGVLILNGCSEVSTSFEQKSSIEVSTSSGINYSSSYTEKKSANGLFLYKINDINLIDGRTEFYISITNNGDRDTTLKEITITFKATDSAGKTIREGSTHFDNLSLSLPRGEEIYEVFAIDDPAYKKFDDGFEVNYGFKNIVVDPEVH